MRTLIGLLCAAVALMAQLPAPGGGGSGGGGGGAGTVTSVDGACGIAGGPISGSGTLSGRTVQNAQSGTSYTLVAGDCGKTVILTNASLVTVTVPAAGASYPDGWFVYIRAEGAGGASLARSGADTINGATSVAVSQGASGMLVSNGAGAWRFLAGGSGGGEPTITPGTTSQYWRGDKTWQTLDKTAVGLSNVANVDTTNAGNIASGTLAAARGGLGANASGFNGVLKMAAGVSSVVAGSPSDCVKVDGSSGVCGSGPGGGISTIKLGGVTIRSDAAEIDFLNQSLMSWAVASVGAGVTVQGTPLTGPRQLATRVGNAQLQDFLVLATGTNTYAGCTAQALDAPDVVDGVMAVLEVQNASTGASTYNHCAAGAKKIFKEDGTTQASTGDLAVGRRYPLIYDSALDSAAGGWRPVSVLGASAGAGGAWGSITGDINTQTDLQTALTAKQSTSAKGAANGYAGLGANSLVPANQLGTGGVSTDCLKKDQTYGACGGRTVYNPLNAFDDSTWSNNGAAAMTRDTSVAGKVRYIKPADAHLAARLKSVGAGDFSFTVGIIPWLGQYANGAVMVGIAFADSGGTQKLLTCGISMNGGNTGYFYVERWNAYFATAGADPTAITAPYDTWGAHNFGRPIYFRGSRTGTNIKCEISQDGEYFDELWAGTEAFFTVTNIGVAALSGANSAPRFVVFGGIIP